MSLRLSCHRQQFPGRDVLLLLLSSHQHIGEHLSWTEKLLGINHAGRFVLTPLLWPRTDMPSIFVFFLSLHLTAPPWDTSRRPSFMQPHVPWPLWLEPLFSARYASALREMAPKGGGGFVLLVRVTADYFRP
ncbi:hypothetical protein L249_2824 [Ophiocordyceps polyrhachis-furcata BCC 54312]|uniref:Uncharacterized protein n=1 Tax=Ophiocordyceps polyrhachis-furcata BCC 54312 TaxID=1330021 RepID=A0A367LMS9_9HYPO|nr:hypothetical protein L249_2824 [Ophiocordyceps polyrhachis-furcata BCC 54312]